MAFTTTQTIDSILARGLNFRLPNNAPISSLYTMYANGQGQTYWSNSINPTNISTLSTGIGVVDNKYSTITSDINSSLVTNSTQIGNLGTGYSNVSTYFSTFYDAIIASTNSSITGIETVSTFYYMVAEITSTVTFGFSTLSTSAGLQNTSTYTMLTSNFNSTIRGTTISTTQYINRQISSLSTVMAYNSVLSTFSTNINTSLLSTSKGLNEYISANTTLLSTTLGILGSSFNSSLANTNFSLSSLQLRTSSLEGMSTNLSTTSGLWINAAISTNQTTTTSTLVSAVSRLSTTVSSVIYSTNLANTSISTMSTASYIAISSLTSTTRGQGIQLSSLAREFSVLTTSSILADVYDTFYLLEQTTSTLIGSTIDSVTPFKSSLFYSSGVQNMSISQAFFDAYVSSLYHSSLSTVIRSTFALTSSLVSSLLSTSTYSVISTINSTAVGLMNSSVQSSIYSYISTPASELISTTSSLMAAMIRETSTFAISTISSINTQSRNAFSTVQNSTIIAYNTFVDVLYSQMSTSQLSTFYSEQIVNLTSNNYTATMDMVTYRNFYVNIFNLDSNTTSNYKLTYDHATIVNIPYRSGVITLNVSTFGYAGCNHPFRFDLYTWGMPTTVWSNFFPSIVNYDYEAQYNYTIINNTLYTSLMNVYPRLDLKNLSVSYTPNVYISSIGTYASNIFWQNTQLTFGWSNYSAFPQGYFGGPSFNPQIAVEIYQGSRLITEYDTLTFNQSTYTLRTPLVDNAIRSTLTAKIYVVGRQTRALTYNFTGINSAYNVLQLENTAHPGGTGSRFLAGNELVVRTNTGLFPLKNATATLSPNLIYCGDSNYAVTNLTNGLLNAIGSNASNAFIARTSPSVGINEFYQQDYVLASGFFQLLFNSGNATISTLAAIPNVAPLTMRFNVKSQTNPAKNVSFTGTIVNAGLNFILGSDTSFLTSNIFDSNGEACYVVADFNLPSTIGTSNTPLQTNFIGSSNGNILFTSLWTPSFTSMMGHYLFQNDWNDVIRGSNMTPFSNAVISSITSKVGTRSATFSGTTSYALVPPMFSVTNLTIAAWVYWRGGADCQRLFDFGIDSNRYIMYSPSCGGVSAAETKWLSNAQPFKASNAPLPQNQWVHLAVVFDDVIDTLALYQNGILVGSNGAVPISLTSIAGSNNYIGRSQWSTDPFFNGCVNELGIWSNALSSNDIFTIYNRQNTPFSVSQRLTYTNLGLRSTIDIVEEIGFYNVFGTSTIGITSTNMLSNTLRVGVSDGTEQYLSTLVFSGEPVQIFRF